MAWIPADFDNIMFFWGQQTYSDRLTIENSLKVFPTWNWMTNRVRAYYERYKLHDEAGAPCVDAPDFTAMTQVDIYTRRTPDYILSCAQDFRKGRMGYQQHPWTASLGGKAVIFTTNPASTEYSNRPNCWAGNLTLPRAVQHENVLLCLYRVEPDFVDYLYSHLYFPRHEMDEVVEKEGWIFGRKGDGYAAVYSLLPGYWKRRIPPCSKSCTPKAGRRNMTVPTIMSTSRRVTQTCGSLKWAPRLKTAALRRSWTALPEKGVRRHAQPDLPVSLSG